MSKKKTVLFSILLVVLVAFTAACSGNTPNATNPPASSVAESSATTSSTAPASEAPKGKIVYAAYDMKYEFYQDLSAGVEKAVKAAGCEYVNIDEKSDENIMITSCLDALAQKDVIGLILTPFKPEASGVIIEAAHKANKPLIMVDYSNTDLDYDAFVTSDNYAGGALAGQYAIDTLKDTSIPIVAIGSDQSGATNRLRVQGFVDAVTKAGYKVVKTLDGKADPTTAYNLMRDALSSNPDVGFVFCGNDPMAISATQAAIEAKKTPGKDILFCGFDAATVAYDAIKKGVESGTIQQQPGQMGEVSVQALLDKITGKELKFDDAEKRIIYVQTKLITIDNVEDIKPKS